MAKQNRAWTVVLETQFDGEAMRREWCGHRHTTEVTARKCQRRMERNGSVNAMAWVVPNAAVLGDGDGHDLE